jgi:large subunit ribosomal protein L25
MPEITLKADVGRPTGSRPAGRLRTEGKIPGVVYGHGMDPLAVAVDGRELRHALTTEAGLNALLALDVAGTTHLTMAREIQRHPVRNTVVHVDFQIVRRDEVVSADVPISLVGEAIEVHRNDGVVEQQLFNLTVHATPGSIPSHLEVDISGLNVGDAVRVGDVRLPSGVTTEIDPEEPVVVAKASAMAADLEEAEAAAAEAAAEAAEEAGEVPEGAEAEAATAEGGAEGQGEGGGGEEAAAAPETPEG